MARKLTDYSGFVHEEILRFAEATDRATFVLVESGRERPATSVPLEFFPESVDSKKPEN